VGEGVAEAERERELSRQVLAGHLSALEARVRSELDWRARLQRDGLRYAVIGVVTLVVAGSVVALRSHRREQSAAVPVTLTSLDDLAAQLDEIKAELAKRRKESGPLWQKVAVRAATAAAAAGGAAVARRALGRLAGDGLPEGEGATKH